MSFEKQWDQRWRYVSDRIPLWVKMIFVPWAVLSFCAVFLPGAMENVPIAVKVFLIFPYFVLLAWFVPMVAARQIHWLSWPARKLYLIVKGRGHV